MPLKGALRKIASIRVHPAFFPKAMLVVLIEDISTTDYYSFDCFLCGPVKTHKYHYVDSLSHAQTLTWTNTTDGASLNTAMALLGP